MLRKTFSFYWLNFDKKGSYQEYWHFLFGYLLPITNYIIDNNIRRTKILVQDCGPVMNNLILEIMAYFDLSVSFSLDNNTSNLKRFLLKPKTNYKNIYVQRWDIDILKNRDISKNLVKISNQLIDLFQIDVDYKVDSKSILILKRSNEHEFYSQNGASIIKKYGANRRYLDGIDEAVDKLHSLGFNVIVYDAGSHSFFNQAYMFLTHKFIVGVRGAEFANLIFAQNTSKVIVYNSSYFEQNTNRLTFKRIIKEILLSYMPTIYRRIKMKKIVVCNLANMLKLNLTFVDEVKLNNPILKVDDIIKNMKENESKI